MATTDKSRRNESITIKSRNPTESEHTAHPLHFKLPQLVRVRTVHQYTHPPNFNHEKHMMHYSTKTNTTLI